MNKIIITILGLFLLCANITKSKENEGFECLLTASKKIYKMGETLKLEVSIKNNSGKDVYLIGSLDGSERKMRNPYCYYTIEKPKKDSLPLIVGCKTLNPLEKEDFKFIKTGGSFNPYQLDEDGLFSTRELKRKENFKTPGKYKITFHYSTKSVKISDYRGDDKNEELQELFKRVPHIKLSSNTVEIEIKK